MGVLEKKELSVQFLFERFEFFLQSTLAIGTVPSFVFSHYYSYLLYLSYYTTFAASDY